MSETFKNNRVGQRYELETHGHLAWADYRLENDTLIIPHVEAEPALRGTGAAGKLMQYIVNDARGKNLKILPLCSYAAAWIKRHAGA
jgi:uncharacterized protein